MLHSLGAMTTSGTSNLLHDDWRMMGAVEPLTAFSCLG
jgi:hypothetical protein